MTLDKKKLSRKKPVAETKSSDHSTQESEELESANPLVSLLGSSKQNPPKVTPANIIALQRTVGNQAVQRMLARQPGQQPVNTPLPGQTIQRTLIPESTRAFDTATAQNPAYGQGRTETDQHMPTGDQKKVVDIRSTFGKTGGAASDLKDFVRAYLLTQYSGRLAKLAADTTMTPGQKKKKKAVYLAKALEVRDKHAPLLKKGPAAPETQAFLEEEGFQAGVAVTAGQQQKELAKGPRIDVRSTFIGGKVLGISLRAHLFIVYTSSEGKQLYFRGGPDEDDFTVADMGDYTPGTVDWDPSAPSVTVLKGPAAANKLSSLIEATSVIDNMKVPYVAHTKLLDGENCNATAWTILNRAGVPAKKPSGVHPGWGNILGSTLKQGNPIEAKPDDLTTVGDPRVIKGAMAQLYKDQFLTEKDQKVAGGTPVTRIEKWTQTSKIRFSDNKVVWISNDDLEKPKVVLPGGRPFRVAGKPNEMHVIFDANKTGQVDNYFPLTGDLLEVLDDAFTPSPEWKDKFVKIKYDDGTGTGEKIGFIAGKNLQAPVVQPIQVPQVDDGGPKGVQPVIVQPDQPRPLKLAVDGMVMDETKAKFVHDYNPKKGELVQVVEPGFTPGDPAWQDTPVKIQYDVEGAVKTGYLLGLDFAVG